MKTSIDIAIIGAGPQALTLVTHLLQKKKSMRDRLMVFDPSKEMDAVMASSIWRVSDFPSAIAFSPSSSSQYPPK
jgi:cation diffusion facilitator CzcD-associated flavoprotein CzcO